MAPLFLQGSKFKVGWSKPSAVADFCERSLALHISVFKVDLVATTKITMAERQRHAYRALTYSSALA